MTVVEERKGTLHRAIMNYGTKPQCMKCIEECSELSRALARYVTVIESGDEENVLKCYDNVVEEIADVIIMAKQMAILFCEPEVEMAINKKLDRLEERIGA